jgi:hypothetical protein
MFDGVDYQRDEHGNYITNDRGWRVITEGTPYGNGGATYSSYSFHSDPLLVPHEGLHGYYNSRHNTDFPGDYNAEHAHIGAVQRQCSGL